MDYTEIDNFVFKFKKLWSAGFNIASLNIESKLGEVFISLNFKVGRVIPPPTSQSSSVSPKRRSPSYYRRQARRKASQEFHVESNSQQVIENNNVELAEQAKDHIDTSVSEPCIEVDVEEDANICQDEESVLGTSADEEDNESSDIEKMDTSSREKYEEEREKPDDVGEELRALIEKSKKERENWHKIQNLEEIG